MCLTTPGRIVSIETPSPDARIADVDFGVGVRRVNLVFTPEAQVGDYVIAQAGFSTRILPEEEAREALAYARQLSTLREPGAALASDEGSP